MTYLTDLKSQLTSLKDDFIRDLRHELKDIIKKEIKEDLINKFNEVTKKVMEIATAMDQVKHYIDMAIEERFEEQNIQRRKKHVVIYNIPESNKQDAKDKQ